MLSAGSYLLGSGGHNAGACEGERDWGAALDGAGQSIITAVLAQLCGSKGHLEGHLHPSGNVALHGTDEEVWKKTLHIPMESEGKRERERGIEGEKGRGREQEKKKTE